MSDDTYFERVGRFKAKADLTETRRLLDEVRDDMQELRAREQRIKVLEAELMKILDLDIPNDERKVIVFVKDA